MAAHDPFFTTWAFWWYSSSYWSIPTVCIINSPCSSRLSIFWSHNMVILIRLNNVNKAHCTTWALPEHYSSTTWAPPGSDRTFQCHPSPHNSICNVNMCNSKLLVPLIRIWWLWSMETALTKRVELSGTTLSTTWALPEHYLSTTWALPEHYLSTTWASYEPPLEIQWVSQQLYTTHALEMIVHWHWHGILEVKLGNMLLR